MFEADTPSETGSWLLYGIGGLASLCCVSLAALAGGAAVAGGTGAAMIAAGSGPSVSGVLVPGLVTLVTLTALIGIARWRGGTQ